MVSTPKMKLQHQLHCYNNYYQFFIGSNYVEILS